MAFDPKKVYFIPNLLTALGAPDTKDNRRLLWAWWAWEGGNGGARGEVARSARFNWLNTMRKAPGSTQFNAVGVQNFPSYKVGLAATVATIKQRPPQRAYPGILAALRSGRPFDPDHDAELRAGLSTWVSGQTDSHEGLKYAERVISTAKVWKLP